MMGNVRDDFVSNNSNEEMLDFYQWHQPTTYGTSTYLPTAYRIEERAPSWLPYET